MNFLKKYWRACILSILIFGNIFIWYVVAQETPTKFMTVAFLNIGQGDAIYIESPTHNKIMVDGGPSSVLLSELRKVMPFYDRSIDTLLVTNPDADHFSGFIDVLKSSFHINHIIEPGTHSPTKTYALFEKIIKEKNIPKIIAHRGMIIHLGGGADLHILFPDQDVSTWKTNDGSIVSQLTFGSTSVMLTGDAPNKTEEYVLSLDGKNLKSTLLKEGHHGSRTSASLPFISNVAPEYDIISAGQNNRYGHPHHETTDLLDALHIPVLITFEKGTIIARSDGKDFTIQTEK
jgi:competence protein ComEC